MTFNRDVAPIVFESCAPCHRPDGAGPFALIDYHDVKKRSRQIAEVSGSGFMPPWLPHPGEHPFVGDRRLDERQVETLKRWHRSGAVEGDPADLPPRPRWSEGWQLGTPDLVATLPAAYTLPAEGVDVFRNLVIPVELEAARWVETVELLPGNPRVVHHGVLQIDRTTSSRRRDAAEEQPGFDGMDMGRSHPPEGHFYGWTPGKLPDVGTPGMGWRLDPGTDLVLQLHMLPSGKPETIRPRVGFYFADEPPSIHPSIVELTIEHIDIPAGESDYIRERRFRLPVDVAVLGVYPHAHYLGKVLHGRAELPDGSTTSLIRIDDWDFNWQDDYRYVEPVVLPAGSTLLMHYTYDNSAENVRNPNHPPRRVVSGNQSSDEMGSLVLQVLTRGPLERARLDEAKARDWLSQFPDAFKEHNNLGNALLALGRPDEAAEHYRRALELSPGFVDARYNLAMAQMASGHGAAAIENLLEVIREDPEHGAALNNLGNARLSQGRTEEAVAAFRRALQVRPSLVEAHFNLGNAMTALERYDEAIEHYRDALDLDPRFAMAQNNLGSALYLSGRRDAAVEAFQSALALDPVNVEARSNLELILAGVD